MAQYVVYSTIVMVNFKQKMCMLHKIDTLSIVKSRIESHTKVGIGEQLFVSVDEHITIINQFQPEGWP